LSSLPVQSAAAGDAVVPGDSVGSPGDSVGSPGVACSVAVGSGVGSSVGSSLGVGSAVGADGEGAAVGVDVEPGEGVAVLLVSTELDEVLQLSDRVAVMYRGQIVDVLPIEEATKERVGLLMASIHPESQAA
jgi:uncharacterized spore protein YtfJ